MSADPTPVVPHLAGEFYIWLWWSTEERGDGFSLGEDVGHVEVWVDERLAFRKPEDTRVSAVMTGENPSTSLEARAALAGGKVLQELRVGFRRDTREYRVTLRGPTLGFSQIKAMLDGATPSEDAVIYDRMLQYEELSLIVGALFRRFTDERLSPAWEGEVLPALRDWMSAPPS